MKNTEKLSTNYLKLVNTYKISYFNLILRYLNFIINLFVFVSRNNEMVNLPWALLVKGDIVLIKPGQISPARLDIFKSIESRNMNPLQG